MIQTVSSGRLVGYARVSTDDQNLTLQIDSLVAYGVDRSLIFTDKISGAKSGRPGLERCLDAVERGDALLVWRLDRLGRSMSHLVQLIEELRDRGVGFRSVSDGVIDTTSASGELIFHIFSALAQFERRLIQERTRAGLAAARARGRAGGRPRIEIDDAKVIAAQRLQADQALSIDQICDTLRISRSTYFRYLQIRRSTLAS